MKKSMLTLAITSAMMFTGFKVFGQQNKKTEKARKDVAEAQEDLRKAKIDSAADFQKFKKDAEAKINENQTKIAELRAKKVSDNKETNEKYSKKISALEQKNNELKKKIEMSGDTKTSMWASFKREFNHDMDELARAIRDIGVDNEK